MQRNVVSLGHIHRDLRAIATAVHYETFKGTVAIWVNGDGTVLGDASGTPPDVPSHWIVGTFGAGSDPDAIEADLRALLRERARDWILD